MMKIASIVTALCLLSIPVALQAQETTITITRTDPWLTQDGWIEGTYSHFDITKDSLYAWVLTNEWWPQPAWDHRWLVLKPSASDSTSGEFLFRVDQNTATVIAVFAYPHGFHGIPESGSRKSLPDEWFRDYPHDLVERWPGIETAIFGGVPWIKKTYPPPYTFPPPDNNWIHWAPENVFIGPEGHLHMRLTFDPQSKKYSGAELVCTHFFGTGALEATLITPISSLHSHHVFGFFNWDGNPFQRNYDIMGKNYPWAHNIWMEYDIEISRWGNDQSSENAQITIAPIDTDNSHGLRFAAPDSILTLRIDKSETQVALSVYSGENKTLIKRVVYDTLYSSEGGTFRINFWPFEPDTIGAMVGEIVLRDLIVLNTGSGEPPVASKAFVGFPNPFTDELIITTANDTEGDVRYSLFNLLGHKVYEKTVPRGAPTQRMRIDGSALLPGVYICVVTGEKQTKAMKFVKY